MRQSAVDAQVALAVDALPLERRLDNYADARDIAIGRGLRVENDVKGLILLPGSAVGIGARAVY